MDRESMTNEENYFFDTEGYIIIPGALTSKEVDSLNSTLDETGPTDNLLTLSTPLRDPFRDLLVHPVLVWYLNQICGHGFRLDRAPRLIGEAAGDDPNAPLQGNNEPRDTARAYYFQNQYRVCHGVRVIWALCDVDADDGGVIEPEDRWGEDIVEGMTEAQFAVMRGSTRDVRTRNTPRLVVENGQLSVSYDAMGDRYEYPVRKPDDKRK